MAAHFVRRDSSKFDIKKIHKYAEKCRKMLNLDALKDDPDRLQEALRGEHKV